MSSSTYAMTSKGSGQTSKPKGLRAIRQALQSFRQKFGFPSKRSSLVQIPSATSAVPNSLIPYGDLWLACSHIASVRTLDTSIFKSIEAQQELLNFTLKNQLNGTTHQLRLPPPMASACEAGQGGVNGESLQEFISMLPQGCRKISKKADPSGLVARLLPINVVSKEARFVGSAFWLWLCAIDDITEDLIGEPFEASINEVKRVFNNEDVHDPTSDVVVCSKALVHVVMTTKICYGSSDAVEKPWRTEFINSVKEILHAFEAEKPLQATHASGKHIIMAEWMNVRVVTISARPFMILAKASLGLNPQLSPAGFTIKNGSKSSLDSVPDLSSSLSTLDNAQSHDDLTTIELLAQCIMGLQNDILGWEKDHLEGNALNAIEVYINAGMDGMKAMQEVTGVHNWLVDKAMTLATGLNIDTPAPVPESLAIHVVQPVEIHTDPRSNSPLSAGWSSEEDVTSTRASSVTNDDQAMTKKYVELLMTFIWSMARWTSSSKRYAA